VTRCLELWLHLGPEGPANTIIALLIGDPTHRVDSDCETTRC
jgi:hypothetical protein